MDLPSHVYLSGRTVEGRRSGQTVLATPIKSVSLENGIYVNYYGAEYPMKGCVPTEVTQHSDIVKAILIEVFKLRPNLKSFLSSFNRIGIKILYPYFLKDEFRIPWARELDSILYDFVFSLTSNESIAREFAQVVSHLAEFDSAYRLRLVDIASETKPIWLINSPRGEIKRLSKLWAKREVQHKGQITKKLFRLINFVRLLLLIPNVKRSFIYAIRKSSFEKLQYDNIDKYWACIRIDYDFMGLNKEERGRLLDQAGYSRPTLQEFVVE